MLTILQSKFGVAGIFAIATLTPSGIQAAALGPVPVHIRCTLDGASVPCNSPRASAGGGVGLAQPNSITSGVSVGADVFLGDNTSASAEIGFSFWATTEGPVRDGLAYLGIFLDGDGNLSGSKSTQHISASLTSSLLSKNCQGFFASCTVDEIPTPAQPYVLFRLGEPFQIQMEAGVVIESAESFAGWSNYGTLELSLWEFKQDMHGFVSLGDPVEILGPVIVPEPRSFDAVMLGISAGALSGLRYRRRFPSRRC